MNRGFCLRKHEINYQIGENDIVAVVHGICKIQICGGDDHTHRIHILHICDDMFF